MASPIGQYTSGNGSSVSVVAAAGAAPCGNLSAINEQGQSSRFCYDGTPNVTIPDWPSGSVIAVYDGAGVLKFQDGRVWTRVIPTPQAIVAPAAVAAAVASPTDFLSGTTFGISNLLLIAGGVVALLMFTSDSPGGRRR